MKRTDWKKQAKEDQRLIKLVLGGSREAFEQLVLRYSDPLYRHALAMTGSPDVADDILQSSFITAYHNLADVRGRFGAWMFMIVSNRCRDWLKNIRRDHVSYYEDDQLSPIATPEEALAMDELRSDLEMALASLSVGLREAFILRHVEGYSYEEMAGLLSVSPAAVKMRVHRAREMLQKLLRGKYDRCNR